MSVTRKVAYNTGVQIAGRVAGLALSLVGVAYLTRYLGPAQFGNYSIAFLYAAIATMITDLGIYTIGLREMAHSDNPERTGSNVMALKTMLQLPLYGLLTLLTLVLPYPDEVKAAVAVAILGAAIASITTTINLFFQYRLRLDFTVAVDLLVKA
jgi:O-antigen/teichoic acid export membrane protein